MAAPRMALKMSAIRAILLQNGMNHLAPLTYKNEKQTQQQLLMKQNAVQERDLFYPTF